MTGVHLAQANIARMKGPLESDVMSGFVALLDKINAVADESPGFVWRLKSDEGSAAYLRPYEDERILFNLSVWKTMDDLSAYVYRSAHADAVRRRHEWFEIFEGVYAALWWIPAGHLPSVEEAKNRLTYLADHGPTPFAFTFKTLFPPDLVLPG